MPLMIRSLASIPANVLSVGAAPTQAPGAWQVAPAATHPSGGTGRGAIAYDSLRQECVALFSSGGSSRVCTWNGTTWQTVVQTPAMPSIPNLRSIAHDPVRDRLLVTQYPGAMYEWDRTTWQAVGSPPYNGHVAEVAWDPTTQRLITVVHTGIHAWDGTSWTLVPGSVLPFTFQFGLGVPFAVDHARNVVVVHAQTQTLGTRTMEWNGASWTSWPTGVPRLRLVYAPASGGVIGYAMGSPWTRRWDPAQHRWDEPGVGHAGLHAEPQLAYDAARGRPVMLVGSTSPVWELDPNASPPPARVLVVDPVGGPGVFTSLQPAVLAAAPGDRILVRAANHGGTGTTLTLWTGIQLECEPSTVLPHTVEVSSLASGQRLSLHGGEWRSLTLAQCAGRIQLQDANVLGRIGAAGPCVLSLQGCSGREIDTLFWLLEVDGGADVIVDGCELFGLDSFSPWPGVVTHSWSAVRVHAGRLTIVASSVVGGHGALPNKPDSPAVENFTTDPVVVLGASTIAAGAMAGSTTPIAGPSATSVDTIWLGTGTPPSPFPSPSWLDAPGAAASGQPLAITGHVQPSDAVFLVFGTRDAFARVPGWRLPIQLDPGTAIVAALLQPGASTFATVVPGVPALVGSPTLWQGFSILSAVTNRRVVLLQ